MGDTHELTDDWIEVFKQRSVWDLEVADIGHWTSRNATFFRLLTELVPAGGRVLELGCGPGRHAISAARLGFRVHGIDINPAVVEQARRNAAKVAPEADVSFAVGDMVQLGRPPRQKMYDRGWDAVTHGGLMEHFPSAESIQASLRSQLELAPLVVFDVPVGTDKNRRLFERDDIFRQDWTAMEWLGEVLAPFSVEHAHTEEHPAESMTDDLVVAIRAGERGRYASRVLTVPRSRQDDAAALRARYPTVVYRSCSAERLPGGDAVTFTAELATRSSSGPELTFRPQVTIDGVPGDHPQQVLDLIAFHLGLAELPSYWKATCSPEILVEAGPLTAAQLDWLHTILLNGMGEYFYVNGIDFTAPGFVTYRATTDGGGPEPDGRSHDSAGVLVPVSGGKDSVVTWELLRSAGLDPVAMTLNPTRAAESVLAVSRPARVIRAHRRIDPRLLELNAAGYLNGHTPFSSYLAVLTTACAMLAGLGRVAMSNERSSDEGNVTWMGRSINHQWSKSLAFERGFRVNAATYLATGVEYFSLLRPLYELQISALFAASGGGYHRAFRSCNRGQALGVWCRQCPKCLGVYTLLSPFVDPAELATVFGGDLFADEGLAGLAMDLLTPDAKPFECVGTHAETLAAFHLAAARLRAASRPPGQKLPPLLATVDERVLRHAGDLDARAAALLGAWTGEHQVPGELAAIVRAEVERLGR